MKKEHWLLVGSVVLTLVVALGLLRWLAPGLLGVPKDLQMVQVSKEVPPFYANIFERSDGRGNDGYLLNDPIMRVRAPGFFPASEIMGPNDLLGFRNRQVPNVADVLVIGDSQTYGNNAVLDQNWPSYAKANIGGKRAEVYSMATGGWAAPQYLQAFKYAPTFHPRAIVVAFYTGNDALESFSLVYGSSYWSSLRPDQHLSASDAPSVPFPPPQSEWWPVSFRGGLSTIFTPSLRFAANDKDSPAVQAGYRIIEEVARQMAATPGMDAKLYMTVIPTKELVYERRIRAEGIAAPPTYEKLVAAEAKNIATLVSVIKSSPNVTYIDTITPLQEAALGAQALYPDNANGHPIAAGYRVIGDAVGKAVAGDIPARRCGLLAVPAAEKGSFEIYFRDAEGLWIVPEPQLLADNGWPEAPIAEAPRRDVLGLPIRGVMQADPKRFGPRAVAGACSG